MRVFVTGATGNIGSRGRQGPDRRRPSGDRSLPFGRQGAGPRRRRRRGLSRVDRGAGQPEGRRRPVGRRHPPGLQPRLFAIRAELRGRSPRHQDARLGSCRLRPALDRDLRHPHRQHRARSACQGRQCDRRIRRASPRRLGGSGRIRRRGRGQCLGGPPPAGSRPGHAGPHHPCDRDVSPKGRVRVYRRRR